jgi:multidrug efflux pump subunit AcrB
LPDLDYNGPLGVILKSGKDSGIYMNPIGFALKRPKTVFVALISLLLVGLSIVRPKGVDDWLKSRGIELPIKRMAIDIFPALNLPVIYVCQPYGGMDPAQMEGLLTNYYEYHFLYINGIHHVESRNVQGTALMKLIFHPGTNMAQAMAETISYVNRSRAMMPPGTVPPFVMRFDTGSVPVGYLVLSSGTKTIAEIQDQALFKVRPMFSSLPGVSAPPPFGGSARSIVIRANPDRLRAFGLSPDDVIGALTKGNTISPSGNVRLGDFFPAVPSNAMVKDIRDLGQIPLKTGEGTVYLRDIGSIEDAADLTTGYALVNGRRAVYILATKRADASTMNVINEIKQALPAMQKELPDDIQVGFEFDQSPYVTRAIASLTAEGLLGAFLTGLMVLLFLRDWRSALVVVLNIPLAILFSIVGLWLSGQTINLMTLGGLALAVGILVDEATVEIENIHTQLRKSQSIALAVWNGNHQTAIPRLLAMLCILAVFVPTFFMQGAPRELFYPLSLAVAFAMIGSYLLSSTLVPILCIWLLRSSHASEQPNAHKFFMLVWFDKCNGWVIGLGWIVVPGYLVACGLLIWMTVSRVGVDIFPKIDAGEFRLRLRAQDGTHIDVTEKLATQVLDSIKESAGADKIALTLGYVGTVPASFPINSVYQFSRGPEEAILRIAFKPSSGINIEILQRELRTKFATQFPNARFSFEPSDIISDVMSFGSSTPVEIAVRGGSLAENKTFAKRAQESLAMNPRLRDVQIVQSLDYPTVDVRIDREKSGIAGATMDQVGRSVLAATSSSRFVVPNYWPDPKSGIGYQVQVEIPQPAMKSLSDLGTVPVLHREGSPLLLRDVAQISQSTMPGEFDRYNMKRELSLTANVDGSDLGSISGEIIKTMDLVRREDDAAKDELVKTGEKPGRVTYELRGQIPALRQMLSGLGVGMVLAVAAIFLLLTASFQSFRLSLVVISTVPAVISGAACMLWLTGTTLNIQSFIGAIMGLGVAMANAILVVTFAEQRRKSGEDALTAARHAATDRLRPVLMTSCAMLAGMLPLAIGIGDSSQQTAPLGIAVIGSLLAATCSTLFVLPAVFAWMQSRRSIKSASLHPLDRESANYVDGSINTSFGNLS